MTLPGGSLKLEKVYNRRWMFQVISIVGITGAFTLIMFSSEIVPFRKTNKTPISSIGSEIEVLKWISYLTFKAWSLPKLEPFAKEVLPFLKELEPPNCLNVANSVGKRIFEVTRGTRILRKVSDSLNDCCYVPFYRTSDQSAMEEKSCLMINNNITELPVQHEFIQVFCKTSKKRSGVNFAATFEFVDGFAVVSKDKLLPHKMQQVEKSMTEELLSGNLNKLNVIVIGIDSTSRMNFLRKMPKSHAYLINKLSAVEMKGYTKVGPNTLSNMAPLLTGLTLNEMKASCISNLHGGESRYDVRVDECPFVWKTFKANGYTTSFAEDDVDVAIFNRLWDLAFENSPTDFYLRPFQITMQRRHSFAKTQYQCQGTRLSFKILLENIENLAEAMQNQSPYFQFTMASRLSHGYINKLAWGDDPLLETLMFLNENGHLEKSALIVMSDHGCTLGDGIRSVPQGKLEDRLPMLFIAMPPWFKTRHPDAWKNLNSNADRLTSVFDVHETFKDFMNLDHLETHLNPNNLILRSKSLSSKGKGTRSLRHPSSLFQQLSPNRTCLDAGIPLHWCTCFDKTPLDSKSETAHTAATFVIRHINEMLHDPEKCADFSLSHVLEVSEKHKENVTWEGGEATKSTSKADIQVIEVVFVTNPHAIFETTIIRVNTAWGMTEKPYRVDSYGQAGDCIQNKEQRPYCICARF